MCLACPHADIHLPWGMQALMVCRGGRVATRRWCQSIAWQQGFHEEGVHGTLICLSKIAPCSPLCVSKVICDCCLGRRLTLAVRYLFVD